MSEAEDCCGNCKYFRDYRSSNDIGKCVRYPPVLCETDLYLEYLERLKSQNLVDPSLAPEGSVVVTPWGWVSPCVFAEDWCGEWSAVKDSPA